MRLSPAAVLRYALAILVVVGVPAAVILLLGTPEPALPSDWGDARARIDGGTFPASYVVDIVSAVLLLGWMAGVWFVVTRLRKQAESTSDETDAPFAPTADDDSAAGGEPDEPWYRQGPPIFDEPFSDEYQRIVVPPDEPTPGDEPHDSVWPEDAMTTEADEPQHSVWPTAPMTTEADDGPLGMFQPDALDEDIAEAEIIGGAGTSGSAGMTSGEGGPSPDDPPMIVPVRAYYFTRAEDTLRSISAQFLNTPTRWEELRSLNAASPGVPAMGPDSLLPVGTALALPGDPLPWGKPDPVYLWTLAEKFLFTAWGREPTPEEVAPFWRGLTSGAQLEAGAPPIQPEHLPAAAFTEPPTPEAEPAAAFTEPAEPPAEEALTEPPPEVPTEPAEPPVPDEFVPVPPPASGIEPTARPTDLQPPAEVAPPAYEAPVPPTHAPAAFQSTPPAYETPAPPAHEPPPPAYEPPSHEPPPPAYEAPAPPTHAPPPPAYEPPSHEPPPPAYEAPAPPTHAPPPPAYEPPSHEPPPPAYETPAPPAHEPAAFQPTQPAYETPAPPAHEPPPPAYEPPPHEPPPPAYEAPAPPAHEPAAFQPTQPAYETPAPPAHEPAAFQPTQPAYEAPAPPAHEPAAFEPPPPAYESPVPPSHEPPPPVYETPAPPTHEPPPGMPYTPGLPDLGPIEPEIPYVEAEAPRMPSYMPSLTGTESAAPTPEAEMVASSSRTLAGTAIGDAMMLWQLSRRGRRRGGRPDAVDPMEESLRQNARVDTLHFIEVAMRHLRAVTVGQLREKPAVLAVRVGSHGFEVLLNRPTRAPDGWHAVSGGYVLELPQGVTADDLDDAAQNSTLCPALIPVGDTLEGPLLLNLEEIGCLIVSGPGSPSVNLLNAVVGTLGSSPLAGDIRIITVGLDTPAGLPGWERVHSTSFDSPQLEEVLSTAHTGSGASLDVLVVGPGNDLFIQRAGQVATEPGSRLALVGATSSVGARWPWRIHVDETTTAVVHPIACTMAAAQAMAPAMSQLLSEAHDPSLLAPPRF